MLIAVASPHSVGLDHDNVVITLASVRPAELSSRLPDRAEPIGGIFRCEERGRDGFDPYRVDRVPMIADAVSSWVAPAIVFVVVIVACLFGLRWLRAEHIDELRSVPLFSGLSDHELLWVLRTARAESFAPGATIIREGDIGGDFFMLTEGTVKVTVDGAEVATLGAGSYFGEIALIDGGRAHGDDHHDDAGFEPETRPARRSSAPSIASRCSLARSTRSWAGGSTRPPTRPTTMSVRMIARSSSRPANGCGLVRRTPSGRRRRRR